MTAIPPQRTRLQVVAIAIGILFCVVSNLELADLSSFTTIIREDRGEHEHTNKQQGNENASFFCQRLPRGQSAAALWNKHSEKIIQATVNQPDDPERVHEAWIRALFRLLTPTMMDSSIHAFPTHVVGNLVTRYLKNETKLLQVLVLGDSVSVGRGCEQIPRELNPFLQGAKLPKIKGGSCSWVSFLQRLADGVIGDGRIQVINNAVGGTSTPLSIPILKYGLFAKRNTTNPDVIINSFSTNDALFSWSLNATINNATASYVHHRKGRTFALNFGHAAHAYRQCTPPAVVYVDTYVGNYHDTLLGEDIRVDAVRQVAQSLPTASMVRATIRDLVWANRDETVFSPVWSRKGKWVREAHPGMTLHVAVAWMLAYSALQTAIEYCENWHHHYVDVPSTTVVKEAEPHVRSNSLPWNVTVHQHASEAKSLMTIESKQCHRSSLISLSAPPPPCAFAFLSNPAGTHRNQNTLGRYVRQHMVVKDGWKAVNDMRSGGWQNKIGLVALKPNATLSLFFPLIQQPIRQLTIHSLRSYGPDWEGTAAQFDVSVHNNGPSASVTIPGDHAQNTSVFYPTVLTLPTAATVGSNLTVNVRLTRGSNFKITAMLLCSR